MKLAFIEMAGFRGVKNHLRIDVPSGFLVIVGRNGSGKSTVCDAIEFALTGAIREQRHKEKGESYADYLWWRGAGTPDERFVRVGFCDSDGAIHQITRTQTGIEPDSQVLRRLFQPHNAPDRPIDALCRTSLIRDEEITSLSVDLPESDRYRFVRDALGNVLISDIEEKLDSLRRRFDERLRKEQSRYERLRDRITDTTTRLSELRASVATSSENQAVEAELRALLGLPEAKNADLLEAARLALTQERDRLDQLHRLLVTTQEITAFRQAIFNDDYLRKQSTLEGQLEAATRDKHELDSQCEILAKELEEKRRDEPTRLQHAELLELGERIGLILGKSCPLCGSEVSQHSYGDHISRMRTVIQQVATGLVELVARYTQMQKTRDASAQLLDNIKRQLSQHLSQRSMLDDLVSNARTAAVAQGFSPAAEPPSAEVIQGQIEARRTKARRLEGGIAWLESSGVTDMIQSLESELQQTTTHANEVFMSTSRIEKAIGKLKESQKSSKSLLGEIIDDQLAELSPLIEEIYRRLRPHVEWTSIRYRLRGDVRRMLSFEVGDGLNPSFVFSSGQRRAAGLAFLLALHLSRPWCRFESLILDDPVQHVDDFRALNLTEVLTCVRKLDRQIVCCVEDEALGQLMCRRFRSGKLSDGRLIRLTYDCDKGVTKSFQSDLMPSHQHVLIPA